MILVTKRVAVAPLELKLSPNESYGRAASVGTPAGAQKAQIQATIIIKLPIHRPGGRYVKWDTLFLADIGLPPSLSRYAI